MNRLLALLIATASAALAAAPAPPPDWNAVRAQLEQRATARFAPPPAGTELTLQTKPYGEWTGRLVAVTTNAVELAIAGQPVTFPRAQVAAADRVRLFAADFGRYTAHRELAALQAEHAAGRPVTLPEAVATAPAPTATATPLPALPHLPRAPGVDELSWAEARKGLAVQAQAQARAFQESLMGRRVQWSGWVDDVRILLAGRYECRLTPTAPADTNTVDRITFVVGADRLAGLKKGAAQTVVGTIQRVDYRGGWWIALTGAELLTP